MVWKMLCTVLHLKIQHEVLSAPVFALIAIPVSAQQVIDHGIDVKSVKVFLNGAQVNREAKPPSMPAPPLLQIENLSQYIDKSSISVSGTGEAVIAGVGFRMEYLTEDRKSPEVRQLEDSAKTLQLELTK